MAMEEASGMPHSVSLPVGVVVARQDIDSPWQDHEWRPVAVFAGAPPVAEWKELRRGEGWVQFHAATLPLELFRKDTEAYKFNLEGAEPVLYVVLAEDDDEEAPYPYAVQLVTASPYEAQDYLDSGEAIVEPIEMPEALLAWVSDFVETHHQEEAFYKRRPDKGKTADHKFGQEPIVVVRERVARERKARSRGDG